MLFQSFTRSLRYALGRDRPHKCKRHIRPDLTVEQFFIQLGKRRVRYAMLRWFDELPHVRLGGDIDVLVDDSDIGKVADLFVFHETPVRCDLFSVSGLPGTSYRGMSYLPVERARELLDSAIRFRGIYMVPAPHHHFLSLAYHAVYQKGLSSGLPTRHSHLQPSARPEHDYRGILASLADSQGVEASITMEGLADYLTESGWSPDDVAIEMFTRHNPWAASHHRGQAVRC